jgi:hypothetical protein
MVILRLFSSVILMDSSGFDYPKVVPPNPLTKLVPNSSTCWVYGVCIYIYRYRTNSLGLSTNITTRSWGFEKMKKHGEMTDKQVGIRGITGPFKKNHIVNGLV